MALVDLEEGARNRLEYNTSCNSLPRLVIKLWSFFVLSFVCWSALAHPLSDDEYMISSSSYFQWHKKRNKKEKEKKVRTHTTAVQWFFPTQRGSRSFLSKHSDSFVFFFYLLEFRQQKPPALALATKSNEIDKRCDQRVSRAPAEYAMACKIYWLYSWVRWKNSMDYLWLSVD